MGTPGEISQMWDMGLSVDPKLQKVQISAFNTDPVARIRAFFSLRKPYMNAPVTERDPLEDTFAPQLAQLDFMSDNVIAAALRMGELAELPGNLQEMLTNDELVEQGAISMEMAALIRERHSMITTIDETSSEHIGFRNTAVFGLREEGIVNLDVVGQKVRPGSLKTGVNSKSIFRVATLGSAFNEGSVYLTFEHLNRGSLKGEQFSNLMYNQEVVTDSLTFLAVLLAQDLSKIAHI